MWYTLDFQFDDDKGLKFERERKYTLVQDTESWFAFNGDNCRLYLLLNSSGGTADVISFSPSTKQLQQLADALPAMIEARKIRDEKHRVWRESYEKEEIERQKRHEEKKAELRKEKPHLCEDCIKAGYARYNCDECQVKEAEIELAKAKAKLQDRNLDNSDPRKVLGVGPEATKKEIVAAYRSLVKKHHPDKGGDPEKFKKIQNAYESLEK
jgi:hypothetical protein